MEKVVILRKKKKGSEQMELIKRQRAFYQTGKTRQVEFRLRALYRLEKAVLSYQKELEEALYQDLRKSEMESAMTEIGMVLSEIRYVRKHLKRWGQNKQVKISLMQAPSKGYVVREPYGCVFIIAPWNYPVLLTLQPLIGAIAGGNCAIIKPSEYASHTAHIIKKLIKQTFPQSYIAVVEGDALVCQRYLQQRFDFIFYTGGETVGKIVQKQAAEFLTPTVLELGGKSPCIVTKTANLSLAAKRIAFGKFLNSGQTCVAPDYVLVEQEVKEELILKLKGWIQKMYGEDPLKSKEYPAIINKKHYNRLLGLLKEDGIQGTGNDNTLQIAPTIIEDAKESMAVMKEEIFGPILPILTIHSMEEAKTFIERREKPLALYLFTGDCKEGRELMEQISFGSGCLNDTILQLASSYMPFGGVGMSGMGNYHGAYSYETFTHSKPILVASEKIDVPLRYAPYRTWKTALIKKFLYKKY